MKKIAAGLLAIMLLTGCSNNNNEQTLFVENSKEKYALVDLDGESKTKFIYDKYETVGNSGFIVVQDDKYGYILNDGSEAIKLGKYKKLESIANMLVGYDKDENITILNSEGKKLYQQSDDVKIELTGLPVIKDGKDYIVLYDTGEQLVNTNDKIVSAYTIDDNYTLVNYEKEASLYYHLTEEEPLSIKAGGDNQLMDHDDKKGYLLYNRDDHEVRALDTECKVLFTTEQELDDLYYDSENNIIGVLNQTTYIFNNKGNIKETNSYYYNYRNYVVKNADTIYGPHTFVNDGKEIEVDGIQLDPLASQIREEIFPVYVRDEGYQYYGFDGKAAFKTVYESAEVFDSNGLAVVSKEEDKYYLINTDNKKISDEYERIEYLGRNYYAGYTSGSRYEVFNSDGDVVIEDSFMGEGTVFKYNDIVYGIFNNSGTSYVYDMEDYEVLFHVEGDLEFNDAGYFVTVENDGYYTLDGEEIYKR